MLVYKQIVILQLLYSRLFKLLLFLLKPKLPYSHNKYFKKKQKCVLHFGGSVKGKQSQKLCWCVGVGVWCVCMCVPQTQTV